MKDVLTLLTLFCTIPLFALESTTLTSNSTTTLENDTIYTIASAGTYTVTTGGVEINTRINVTTNKGNITLILDRCHLITPDAYVSTGTPYYGAPIVITGKSPKITLQFKGENALQCAPDMKTNRFAGAITLCPNDEGRDISLTLEGVDDDASLTLHGRTFNNTQGSAYGPIYLPDDSTTGKTVTTSVTLKRGKFHFISSDTTQAPMLTPAITATNITLDGATITASIAPFNKTSYSETKTWGDIITYYETQNLHPIFRCTTFTMKEGTLKTDENERVPVLDDKIGCTSNSYDTIYAVPDALLTLPSFATTAYGTIYGQTFTTFYGLNTQGESNALKACFSPTGDVSLSSNALTINAAQAQPTFADNHLNPTTALAASRLFQLPLTATDQGFTMQPYAFGIRTITATPSQVSLAIALNLPNIDANLKTKAISLHILCNGTIVSQSPTRHTFTRQADTDTFITTVTVPYPFDDKTQGTACYTVRAISE